MPSPIMKHFRYSHLPPRLQAVSQPFAELAKQMDEGLPNCAEKSSGLRKLLEAKDCMVRAELEVDDEPSDAPRGQTNAFMLHSHGSAQHSHDDGNKSHYHKDGKAVLT